MHLYDDLEQARALLPRATKWSRLFSAAEESHRLPAGPMYSIGDSLTWRVVSALDAETEFQVRRRYLRAVYCRAGAIRVEAATTYRPLGPYSDLDDRQRVEVLDGARPSVLSLEPGQLAVLDISEASRVIPAADSSAMLAHLTVEGPNIDLH